MERTTITRGFWHDRLQVNAQRAIFHQWEQLEASGCIHNFRLAAGLAEGWREGWFFADSDAYKWLEAAARVWQTNQDERLGALMDGLIDLLGQAQTGPVKAAGQGEGAVLEVTLPGYRGAILKATQSL